MNVNFEKTDDVNGVMTVSLVEDDYKNEVKKRVKSLGMKHPLKGFRPGHVPASLLNRYYGPQVTSEVVDGMVSRAISQYIIDNNLPVMMQPLLNEDTHVDLMKEKDVTFKFDLGLRPEVKLSLNKRMKIPYYNIEVTQEMIDKQNEDYRRRYGKQVQGEVSENDSLLKGSMQELADDGTPKEGGLSVESTIISPQYLADEEESKKFVGAHVKDEIRFNPFAAAKGNVAELTSMLNVDRDQAADVKSDFCFTVNEVLVNQPAEMNQEFFDTVLGKDQAKTEEEYMAKLKEVIEGGYRNDSNYRFTIDAQKALTKSAGELPMPEDFLKRYLKSRGSDDEKMSQEDYEKKVDEEFPELLKYLRWQTIKAKVAEDLKLEVSVEDKRNLARFYAAQQFAQYGMTNVSDDIIDNYAQRILEDEQQSNSIEERALDDKMFAAIKEKVKIDEKSVTLEAFNDLFKADSKAK